MITDNSDYGTILARRTARVAARGIDARSTLQHFALINYALPRERLDAYIPADRFLIPEFEIRGEKMAMLSVVPFFDLDFHFVNVLPFLRFGFGQTNHRVYVIDQATGEHCVWFFGTTLGSPLVYLPRLLWKIPWHNARYQLDCVYDRDARRYRQYRFTIESGWCGGIAEIEDTGEPVALTEGFDSVEQMQLILTHPLDGYFHRLDGQLGTYSVWHELISLTVGRPKNLYFSLYERLGLLSAAEMQKPHSVFLCPETEFLVRLPPRELHR